MRPHFPESESLAARSAALAVAFKRVPRIGSPPPRAAHGLPDPEIRSQEESCKKTNEPKSDDF